MSHPGVVSLVTKSFFLVVAILLATFGIHKDRPFLLHCIDENSTLLNMMDNDTLCSNLSSCFSEPTTENFSDLSGALKLLDQASRKFEEEANKTTLVKEKIEQMRKKVAEVQHLREQVKEELQKMGRNPEKLVQKVRVCGENETTIMVVTLSSLISLLLLAALATYQLHKITDYKVGQSLSHYCVEKFKLFGFRSSLKLQRLSPAVWKRPNCA